MKKAFSLLFITLSLLAFKNITCTKPEADACFNFLNAGDYRKAIETGRKAVQKDPNNLYAHLCLGASYYKTGEFRLALEHMKMAENLTSNKGELMHIYTWIGSIYSRMGYLDDALIYLRRSLRLARDLGDKRVQASVLSNIAEIYYKKNKLDKALSYYIEALSLGIDEKEKVFIYNNIANIYADKGDYQRAVEYFQKAIEIGKRYGEERRTSVSKLNLGSTYIEMGDYEEAEKYLLEGLEGVKKVGDKYWEAKGYGYLGVLYIYKGDKKTAKAYLTRAYNLFKSIGAERDAKDVLFAIRKLGK